MTDPELLKGFEDGFAEWDGMSPEDQWAIIHAAERQSGIFRDAEGKLFDEPPDSAADIPAEPPAARPKPSLATADAG